MRRERTLEGRPRLVRQVVRPEEERKIGEIERFDFALDAVPETRAKPRFHESSRMLRLV